MPAHAVAGKVRAYIAADYSRIDEASALAKALDGLGIEVVSRWHTLASDVERAAAKARPGTTWDAGRAVEVALRNTADLDGCDVLVLLTTGDASRGGRHFEAGYAFARGKPVVLVGPAEHAFHYLPEIARSPSSEPAAIAELISWAAKPDSDSPTPSGPALFSAVDSLQIPVPDLEAGLSFYRQLLGDAVRWRTATAVALAMEDGTEVVLQTERPAPETDVLVRDADQAVQDFVAAGGSAVVPPFDVPVGRCAAVADPWGTQFVILDLSKGTFDTDPGGLVTGVSRKAPALQGQVKASDLPDPSVIADVYVIVRRDDRVLLLLRSGTGYKDGQWGPPSGKVEPGETYREAAARELGEETGLDATPGGLRFLHVVERLPDTGSRWVGMFFEFDGPSLNATNREPQKHAALEFFPLSDLPATTVDYVRHVLDACARGKRSSEWRYSAAEEGR